MRRIDTAALLACRLDQGRHSRMEHVRLDLECGTGDRAVRSIAKRDFNKRLTVYDGRKWRDRRIHKHVAGIRVGTAANGQK
jgi:hypothetical protein